MYPVRGMVSLIAAAFSLCAHAQGILRLAGTSGYHERFESATQVSGGTVLGVQATPNDKPFDPRRLSVYAPPGSRESGDLVCVQVTTSSGHYWSRNAYELADSSGWTQLETQSRFVERLGEFKAPAYAMRAELKPRIGTGDPDRLCATAARGIPVFLVAGMDAGAPPVSITILVNSKRSRVSAELQPADGGVRSVARCERIRDIATRAYDSRCDLSLPQPAKGRYPITITLAEPGEEPEIQRVILLLP